MSEIAEVLEDSGFEAGDGVKETAVKVVGNIHKKEFGQFWLDTLKPEAWTCRVLQEGYKLSFLTQPDKHIEGNNQSAKQKLPFLKEKVPKLLEEGVVSRV